MNTATANKPTQAQALSELAQVNNHAEYVAFFDKTGYSPTAKISQTVEFDVTSGRDKDGDFVSEESYFEVMCDGSILLVNVDDTDLSKTFTTYQNAEEFWEANEEMFSRAEAHYCIHLPTEYDRRLVRFLYKTILNC
jgi:hypothetical protein